MPELPEVETWRRLAERHAVGRTIGNATVADDSKIFDRNAPQTLREKLASRTIAGTGRRGKHMWLTFDTPDELYLHFGMTGSLHWLEEGDAPPSHTKLQLHLEGGGTLAYRNMRRIGRVRLLDPASVHLPISGLGPDPLKGDLSIDWMFRRLAKRKGPVKSALLDQKLFAGVGNWIADEVLYQAKLDPHRRCSDLSDNDIRRLRNQLLRVIDKAVEAGADAGRFPRAWLFHHRWGKTSEKTVRGEAIRFDTIGGRTTAWAPERQS